MGRESGIEWTDATWNPWLGCTKVSPGCRSCYAERIEERYGRDFSKVRRASNRTFNGPLRWEQGCMVFTCSMSDFFHEDADGWRDEAWEVIRQTPQHTYQILTKRPERIRECLPKTCFRCGDKDAYGHHAQWDAEHDFIGWTGMGVARPWPNVWLGTSVEMQQYLAPRIGRLVAVPAVVHFLSCEPLLGPLDFGEDYNGDWEDTATVTRFALDDIEWVITGGESGSDSVIRPADSNWFRAIRDQCKEAGVPFFHKQNGGSKKCKCHGAWGCRLLDGRTWDEMP